ncbi:M23 family metallopeptidase [Aliagarivorans marinus]|uniref:M23 family metallopeptidase n=1 Tax=Aliagarivorans marinus TaxID=561965 RepID=UPI000685E451|nr:M23 family metallopeptidase [Aliagarivorans marinus]
MKLRLVYAHKGQTKTLRLHPFSIVWLTTLLCLLAGSAIYWGSAQYRLLSSQNHAYQLELQTLRQQVLQQAEIQPEQVKLLSSQVGILRAEVSKLKQAGARLADDEELAEALNQRLESYSDLSFEPELPDSSMAQGGPMLDYRQQFPELNSIYQGLAGIELDLNQSKKQLGVLESWQQRHHLQSDSYLSGWPSYGEGVWLSSRFGSRIDPFTGRQSFHRGVDIAGAEGTPIFAVGAGVVVRAGDHFGYGKLVEIEHGDGMVTRYAHASDVLVAAGDIVAKGQEVALMGSTGRSTGPHVHFEVLRHGRPLNPSKYIYRKARG